VSGCKPWRACSAPGKIDAMTIKGDPSAQMSAAGSAAEQAIVHSAKPPFDSCFVPCSGQCCIIMPAAGA